MSATAIPGENHSQFEHYLLIVRNGVREARLRRTMLTLPGIAPPIHLFFFMTLGTYAREGTIPMQSSHWSFIGRFIDRGTDFLMLHARRRGWPGARNV